MFDNFDNFDDFDNTVLRPRPRRRVIVATNGEGSKRKLWAYGYEELSHLLGLSEYTVRKKVSRGLLDPASLDSVFEFFLKMKVKGLYPKSMKNKLNKIEKMNKMAKMEKM